MHLMYLYLVYKNVKQKAFVCAILKDQLNTGILLKHGIAITMLFQSREKVNHNLKSH